MYAGKSRPIPMPTIGKNERIYALPNGYIYYYNLEHRQKKAEDLRSDSRPVCIGKIHPSADNMMYPGRNFGRIFGSQYSANEVEASTEYYSTKARREAGKLDIVLSYAPYALLEKLSELSGLLTALKNALPRLWKELLALAVHAVVSCNTTAQHFPYWAFDHWCGLMRPMSDSTISRIFSELSADSGRIQAFFEFFQKEFHSRFPCSHERVIALDSTNQVTESKNSEMAQRGKSKTGEKHPIINTAMYVDEKTGISLWYEHFAGNVLDKSQTPYTVEKAQQLGFEKLFYMMDRGYQSQKTLNRLDGLGVGFGVILPDTTSLVSKLIGKYSNELKNTETWYIPGHHIYGIRTVINLDEDKEFHAYVYYDPRTFQNELEAIHCRLDYYLQEAKKRKRYSEKMKAFFAPLAIKVLPGRNEQTGQNFTLEIDSSSLLLAREEAGFFVILSNRLMTPEEMIIIARGRDSAEKAFRDLKSHFGLDRTNTHSDATYCGKMFSAFVSLVLLQSFRWVTRSLLESKSSETISTLLDELTKYKILVKKDGLCMPVYAMNKKQKALFEAVNLTEEQVENAVRALKIEDHNFCRV